MAANPGLPSLRAGLAQVLCWLDRTEDATAIVADAARDGFDHVGWDYPGSRRSRCMPRPPRWRA